MGFWIVAGAMALTVAALLALAVLGARRGSGAGAGAPETASDVRVYRDQLSEIDRDLARGVLSQTEAERVRTEVARRLLDADRKAQAAAATETAAGPSRVTAAVLVVAVLGGAGALYTSLGAPGYPDLPLAERLAELDERRANRPAQAEAEAQAARTAPPAPTADPRHLELLEQLRAALEDRPDDAQGYTLLARNEASVGNFAAAARAQERLIEIKGMAATGADYADLADLMIMAAGGYVSPEAEIALGQALRRDPTNAPALYYTGLLYAQIGRYDSAFSVWRGLLERSAPSAPWYLPILAQIEEVAMRAGVQYTPPLPPGPTPAPGPGPVRGPSAEDIEAAGEMAAEDRQAMIEGMVASLSSRLANSGGTAEEWAQLITALGVLGRTDEARAIADEARMAFAGEPDLLPLIEAARQRAGIGE